MIFSPLAASKLDAPWGTLLVEGLAELLPPPPSPMNSSRPVEEVFLHWLSISKGCSCVMPFTSMTLRAHEWLVAIVGLM